MGPPLLHHHASDTWLSQMPAITMALGRRHGLCHDPDLDLRLACDASDVLLEITNSHGAQMWDPDDWAAFRADRLPRWMRMHDRDRGRDGGWLSGTNAPATRPDGAASSANIPALRRCRTDPTTAPRWPSLPTASPRAPPSPICAPAGTTAPGAIAPQADRSLEITPC
ncbi:MAG: hypothetical protein ACE368_14925 [Paracoccaceae bacterium]